jgi:hypothetical protein
VNKLSEQLQLEIATLQFVDDKHRLSYFDQIMPYVITTLEKYEELNDKSGELIEALGAVL